MSESRFTTAKDGLRLHALDYGDRHSTRLPVVCLPGLTRTVEDFATFAAALASDRRVLSLDYAARPIRLRSRPCQLFVPDRAR
jgi:hypothetical protein